MHPIKSVFLKILNVPIRSVFVNSVTYIVSASDNLNVKLKKLKHFYNSSWIACFCGILLYKGEKPSICLSALCSVVSAHLNRGLPMGPLKMKPSNNFDTRNTCFIIHMYKQTLHDKWHKLKYTSLLVNY